jgi:type III secretion protein J
VIQNLHRWGFRLVPLLLFVFSGCSDKVELYSRIEENECNEMLAVLLDSNIPAEKIAVDDNLFTLQVVPGEMRRSIDLLRDSGYPKAEFNGIAESFSQSSLVSSPLEERIRYMHALSEELAATITTVDGVITARVHIVLPENTPFGEQISPSSASVFIKHSVNRNLSNVVPEIKSFVQNSIEGLTSEKVAVVLFQSDAMRRRLEDAATPEMADVFNVQVAPQSQGYLKNLLMTLGGVAVLNFVLLVLAGFMWFRTDRRLKESRQQAPT